jgi:glutathionyl-hydroquinone reductase
MFNASFNNLAQNPDMDLYPEDLRAKIDEVRVRWRPRVCVYLGGGSAWGVLQA